MLTRRFFFILAIFIGFLVPNNGLSQGLCRLVMEPTAHVEAKPVPAWVLKKTHEEREAYLIQLLSKGSKNYDVTRTMSQGLLALPEAAREGWLTSMARSYRKIPKKDPNPTASWHIGGRRLLDRVFTLVERYDQKAQSEIKGPFADQFLVDFYSRQQMLFGSNYSYREISKIVSFFKQEAARLQAQLPGPEITITMAGSFANGKASLTASDIDLSISNFQLLREVPQWQNEINHILKAERPETNLTIEAHGEPKYFYGQINPLVIEISARRVRLHVFPPSRVDHSNHLAAGEPLTFDLNF